MASPASAAPAVVVDGVAKAFTLPAERRHTLKERALHPFRRTSDERLHALRDVSFTVPQGEFFGIVGRNGSGKSTLLKCLAGIYGVDAGEIRMAGRLSTFIELGVGFNPDLAARDNVLINGIMLGLSPAEALRRFEAIIAFAELEDFVDLKLKNYSSGMHVRLAFSVMIQVDADILLIDEVLAVGDAAFQQKCFDVFHRLRDQGKTILFVTHDMDAVRRFCHRALLIERGEVRLIGEPERVGQHYLELNFGRDPAAAGASADGEGERYGDGGAEILEAWFEDDAGRRTEQLVQGRRTTVRVRLAARVRLENPNVCVLLENEAHQPLFATSTADAGLGTGVHEPGEETVVSVGFENLLGRGRVYATPWLVHEYSARVIDRRPRLATGVVTGGRPSGSLVELPHDVRYERADGGTTATATATATALPAPPPSAPVPS